MIKWNKNTKKKLQRKILQKNGKIYLFCLIFKLCFSFSFSPFYVCIEKRRDFLSIDNKQLSPQLWYKIYIDKPSRNISEEYLTEDFSISIFFVFFVFFMEKIRFEDYKWKGNEIWWISSLTLVERKSEF